MASLRALILASAIVLSTSDTIKIKINSRPVHEIHNEQSRADSRIRTAKAPQLPYGNPFADNSQQNYRLYTQNQKAMFNAEKVRQHRAQIQRWSRVPQPMDTYMKAYHESQENHQLALEKQQERLPKREKLPRNESRIPKRLVETMRITAADAIKDGGRSHRSHGSDHQNYLAHKRYQTIYVSPATTYDQGVTIKPNGIGGLSRNPETQTTLFTKAIPSTETPYAPYPSHSIDNLSSLLGRPAQEQVSHLNALVQASKGSEIKDNGIETPIELLLYQKDTPMHTSNNHYESNPTLSYASAYLKDHTTIVDEIDEINPVEDNMNYAPPPQMDARPNFIHAETTTTKSNNYYKVEVASQTIKSGVKDHNYYKHEPEHPEVREPSYQEVNYQPVYYYRSPTPQPQHENYVQSEHKGLQHLTAAGTEVSLYDDESENLHYASNYEFGYRVHDYEAGNDFGHQEAKNGDNTNGQYHVLLPDGRMQRVKYSAGPEGFHADVSYDHTHLLHEK